MEGSIICLDSDSDSEDVPPTKLAKVEFNNTITSRNDKEVDDVIFIDEDTETKKTMPIPKFESEVMFVSVVPSQNVSANQPDLTTRNGNSNMIKSRCLDKEIIGEASGPYAAAGPNGTKKAPLPPQKKTILPPVLSQTKAFKEETVQIKRLMKEFSKIQLNPQNQGPDPIMTVELVNEQLNDWHIKLYQVEKDSILAADMKNRKIKYILLHLKFPDNFPFGPPFMRVVEPAIFGGYVVAGGAICMELLTTQGWAPSYSIEAVILQFAATVTKGQGRLADVLKDKNYNLSTAKSVFKSLEHGHGRHGWAPLKKSEG